VVFVQFGLFLLIGLLLFVVHSDRRLPAPRPLDRLYPEFVWNSLPHGLAGLAIAAILAAAMSNLSAALNALASTTVLDFGEWLRRKSPGAALDLRIARAATVAWAAVLFVIGAFARHWGGVLETGLTIASIAYGGLLGVFLLGMLPRRIPENAAIAGMVAGVGVEVYLKLGTHIAWTWYAAIGTAVTMATALLVSPLLEGVPRDR
jgi:Na+/proline symporter